MESIIRGIEGRIYEHMKFLARFVTPNYSKSLDVLMFLDFLKVLLVDSISIIIPTQFYYFNELGKSIMFFIPFIDIY